LAAGFEQLLVYVEDEDIGWAEKALHGFIISGQVTLVPFFFGNISQQMDFLTQGAMENHCSYQARGRATWMAHNDIDEYFDFIQPFAELSKTDGVLIVRSQFWGVEGKADDGTPFPCNITGKENDYFPARTRSKVIFRPEQVVALFPHFVVKERGCTEVNPNPETELRLNHFKQCATDGKGCRGKTVFHDLGHFRDRCAAMLARRMMD